MERWKDFTCIWGLQDEGQLWGDEFTPSLSISEPKINAKGDIVNDDKGSFGSDPEEENRSDLISSSELPNEVEDKPPPSGCERGKLKEKHLMHKYEHNSNFCTLLQQYEFTSTSEVNIDNGNNLHPPIISKEVHEPPSIATRKA